MISVNKSPSFGVYLERDPNSSIRALAALTSFASAVAVRVGAEPFSLFGLLSEGVEFSLTLCGLLHPVKENNPRMTQATMPRNQFKFATILALFNILTHLEKSNWDELGRVDLRTIPINGLSLFAQAHLHIAPFGKGCAETPRSVQLAALRGEICDSRESREDLQKG
jgi:hypothetical protein